MCVVWWKPWLDILHKLIVTAANSICINATLRRPNSRDRVWDFSLIFRIIKFELFPLASSPRLIFGWIGIKCIRSLRHSPNEIKNSETNEKRLQRVVQSIKIRQSDMQITQKHWFSLQPLTIDAGLVFVGKANVLCYCYLKTQSSENSILFMLYLLSSSDFHASLRRRFMLDELRERNGKAENRFQFTKQESTNYCSTWTVDEVAPDYVVNLSSPTRDATVVVAKWTWK